jgi:hypothetical protein
VDTNVTARLTRLALVASRIDRSLRAPSHDRDVIRMTKIPTASRRVSSRP